MSASSILQQVKSLIEYCEDYRVGKGVRKFISEQLELDSISIDSWLDKLKAADNKAIQDDLLSPLSLQEFHDIFTFIRDYEYAYAGRKYLYALAYKNKVEQEGLSTASKVITKGATLA